MHNLITAIINAIGLGKVVGALIVSTATWTGVVIAQQFAQLDEISSGGASDLIAPAVLTASTSALVWVVKQFGSGSLVHRSVADVEAANAEQLKRANELLEASHKREQEYHRWLMEGRSRD